jgi:hypothetical protein
VQLTLADLTPPPVVNTPSEIASRLAVPVAEIIPEVLGNDLVVTRGRWRRNEGVVKLVRGATTLYFWY